MASDDAHACLQAHGIGTGHGDQGHVVVEGLAIATLRIVGRGGLEEAILGVGIVAALCHPLVVGQRLVAVIGTRKGIGQVVVGLEDEETMREFLNVVGETSDGIVVIASKIAVLGSDIECRVLLHRRHGGLGGEADIGEVLLGAILLNINVLDGHQRVAGLVGASIAGQQLVEGLEGLVVAVGVVIDKPHIEQSLRHIAALRVFLDKVVVVEQRHLVVVADEVGVGNLEHGFGREGRIAVTLEYVVQAVEFLYVLALCAIAEGFLVGGIVGILTLGVDDAVIVVDGGIEALAHI